MNWQTIANFKVGKYTEKLKLKIENYKIIFVDDGSEDNTWQEIINKHLSNPKKVIGIKLSRNFVFFLI